MAKTSKQEQAVKTRAANATKSKTVKEAEKVTPEAGLSVLASPASEPASEAPKSKSRKKAGKPAPASEPASPEPAEVSSEATPVLEFETDPAGHIAGPAGPLALFEGASEAPRALVKLSEERRERRDSFMAIVNEGVETFRSVGNALLILRNEELYLETHSSFSEFVSDHWGFTGRKAHYLMSAASAVNQLEQAGVSPEELPKSESAARPLTSVPEEKRPEVWKAARATAASEGRSEPTRADSEKAAEGNQPARGRGRPRGSTNKPKAPASQDERVQAAVASGVVAEGTTIETTYSEESASEAPAPATDLEADDKYLESFDKIRDELIVNTRRIFDASALAFRDLAPARSALSQSLSLSIDKHNKTAKTIGPYLARFSYAIRTSDPSTWQVCQSCKGNGVATQALGGGNCSDCRGNGFIIP